MKASTSARRGLLEWGPFRSLARVRASGLVFTVALLGLLWLLGAFETVELNALNSAFSLRGPRQPGAPVVIVAVDQESFDQTRLQWPWPRDYTARIVENIAAGGPKVIALDMFFYEEDQRAGGDAKLAEAIRRAGNVVVTNEIAQTVGPGYRLTQVTSPIPAIAESVRAVGLANFSRDRDAFVRRLLLWQAQDGELFYSWSYWTAALYLGATPDPAPEAGSIRLGERVVPLEGRHLLVNFRGGPRTFPYYPAYQVAGGEIPPETFAGKIVLVGATIESLHDTYPTPFSGHTLPMPGVEVNAHGIDTLLEGDFIGTVDPRAGLLIVALMALAGYLLSRLRPALLVVVATIGGLLAYAALWFGLFAVARLEAPVVVPALALAVGVFVPTLERAVSEELEKRRVRGIFERFISPQMVRQLIETQDIRSLNKRADLTILFSDIRGFTTISEKMAPDALVELLNEYLSVMTEIIHHNGGTVDKYEGDAILAFYGEPIPYPDHPRRAVQTALEMRAALDRLRQKWAGGSGPAQFEIGIGLNTGDVFVGLIGSEKRVNYTVIGDNVNLAARLQDLTKELAWPILISGATYKRVNEEYETEFVAARLVKGKTEPVAIYRVLGKRGASEAERVRALFR